MDFFVSYTESDKSWAEWISWQLEAAGYRVLVQAWDFGAGAHFVHEMHRAAIEAERTVAVLSAAYLTCAFGEAEWQAAWAADPSGTGRKLLAVRVEDCARPGLLGQLVGVDLFGVEEEVGRRRLLAAAGGMRGKPTEPPSFPGGVGFPGLTGVWEAVWQPGRSPFPGLDAFDASRAAVFKGREEDTRRLVEALSGPDAGGLLAVAGPSGCGKSSLVAAGLAPTLAEDADWLVTAPLVAGGGPITAVAGVLAEAGRGLGFDWTMDSLAARLEEPDAVVGLARQLLRAARARRLLLIVDQAEELLSPGTSTGQQEWFFGLLAAAAGGPVRVVATVRSEYLDGLSEQTARVGLRVRVELVQPLERDLLPLVITGPAGLAGLDVEDELVARMVADTGDGQGLPLLAYTLSQLYARARQSGATVLSGALYKAVGGVQGALVAHAAAALAEATAASGHHGDQVLAALLHLVSVDEEERPARRRVPLEDLPGGVRAALVPFVTKRLLTVDAVRGGAATVEVAHERLLIAWPPLTRAIRMASDRLRQRSQADAAAAEWKRHGRVADRLWPRGLAGAALTALGDGELTPTTLEFLKAGRRRGRQRLVAAFSILSVLLLVATSLGVVAELQRQSADRQSQIANRQSQIAEDRRRTAVADRLLTLADTSREDDPTAALRYAVAAGSLAPGDDTTARIRGNLLDTFAELPALPAALSDLTGPASVVAFGSDGLLATGGGDGYGHGEVRLWDTSNPEQARPLGQSLDHTGRVSAMAFGPDGLLATGSDDDDGGGDRYGHGEVRLWDTSNPEQARPLGQFLDHIDRVYAVEFGPDGLLATSSSDSDGCGQVRLWDTSNPEQVHPLGQPLDTGTAYAVAFGPDGLLATSSSDGTVWLWDTSNPEQVRPLGQPLDHTGPVNAVAFGPDGLLATSSSDGTVWLWDTSNHEHVHPVGQPLDQTGPVNAVAFGPDGLLATSSRNSSGGGTVRLWDTSNPEKAHPLGQPFGWGPAVAFGPDGLLATNSDSDGHGGIRLWDTSNHGHVHPVGQPLNHTDPVNAVTFGPDGLLATSSSSSGGGGGGGGTVRLWDTSNHEQVHPLGQPLNHTDPVYAVTFGPDGLLATSSSNSSSGGGTVRLWDTSNHEHVHPVGQPLGQTGPVNAVVFGPDGLLATSGNDGTVRLWDTSNPEQVRPLGQPFTGHASWVSAMAFGPDGLLATSDGDGAVRLWDTSNPEQVRPLGQPFTGHASWVSAMAFGPDGLLATSSLDGDGAVRLWDTSNRGQVRPLGQPFDDTGRVSAVAFGPDGLLATSSLDGDGAVRLWDTSNPEQVRPLGQPLDHTGWVSAVAFGPDGLLATSGYEGTVRLWDVEELQWLREHAFEVACRLVNHGLTESEWRKSVSDMDTDPYRDSCGNRRPAG
ncbi:hypothetical protein ACG83_30005 [Frankia sp. R43]|nr:hypothetical protein ACG83_30005 [Frankia sp. R43]